MFPPQSFPWAVDFMNCSKVDPSHEMQTFGQRIPHGVTIPANKPAPAWASHEVQPPSGSTCPIWGSPWAAGGFLWAAGEQLPHHQHLRDAQLGGVKLSLDDLHLVTPESGIVV